MADEFKITKEIMAQANTYIPIAMKEMIATDTARACVKETYMIRPHGEKHHYDGTYGLSPIYCESPSSKSRVLLTVLMAVYLRVWGEDTPLLCEAEEYDKWAGAHVLNQLERFKSGEYREKAFDLLADYREMERYLNSAIYSVLREMNDPVKRFLNAVGEMTSAESIQNAIDGIKEAQEEIEKEKARQERIINEEEEEAGEGIAG